MDQITILLLFLQRIYYILINLWKEYRSTL